MSAFDSLIIAFFIALLGIVVYNTRTMASKNDLNSMEKRIEKKIENLTDSNKFIDGIIEGMSHNKTFIDQVLSIKAPGNPYTQDEKEKLIQAYQSKTITTEQAERLKEILQEDIDNNKGAAALGAFIVLLGVSLLLSKSR